MPSVSAFIIILWQIKMASLIKVMDQHMPFEVKIVGKGDMERIYA